MNHFMLAAVIGFTVAAAGGAYADDAAMGKKLFIRCKACHSVKAGKNGVGPSLYGVVGRTAAAVPKYSYSAGLKAAGQKGLTWDRAKLIEYLKDPKAFLKAYLGKDNVTNKMINKFASKKFRYNIVSYLETLKN